MAKCGALIIDDDPLLLVICEETLANAGWQRIETFDDPRKAMARLKGGMLSSDPIDLIVCDLNMPGIDGVTIIRELAKIKFAGSLVIISGENAAVIDVVDRMARQLGISVRGALTKPFNERKFLDVLDDPMPSAVETPGPVVTQAMALRAIQSGQLVPVYQPKVPVDGGAIEVEVLARLKDGDALTSAGSVIAASEDSGLITPLTLALLERTLAELDAPGAPTCGMPFSLNISPKSLTDRSLPDQLFAALEGRDRSASTITLEITENLFLSQSADVLEVLARLRLFGFALSIDDFGTGATSIEQLRLYPFTELKIDRSFVAAAGDDVFARTTVETSVRLAQLMNMRVVAEGVETDRALHQMLDAGTNLIQGFLLARPLTIDALATFLARPRRALAA